MKDKFYSVTGTLSANSEGDIYIFHITGNEEDFIDNFIGYLGENYLGKDCDNNDTNLDSLFEYWKAKMEDGVFDDFVILNLKIDDKTIYEVDNEFALQATSSENGNDGLMQIEDICGCKSFDDLYSYKKSFMDIINYNNDFDIGLYERFY